MNLRKSAITLACAAATTVAHSQQISQCTGLAATLKEYNISNQSSAFLNSTFDQYCEQSGEAKSSSGGVGLDVVIKAIPIKFTGNYGTTAEGFKNFCKAYASVINQVDRKYSYDERVASRALDTIDSCVRIASTGAFVSHDLKNSTTVSFFMSSGPTTKLELRGLYTNPPSGATCAGQVSGIAKAFDKNTNIKIDGTQSIECTRVGSKDKGGKQVFEEVVLTLHTNIANYSVVLPREERLPPDLAQEISRKIERIATDAGSMAARIQGTESALAQDRAAIRYSFVPQSGFCPTGWSERGILGWIMPDNADYNSNTFGLGAVAFGGWKWTHPKLCSR